MTTQTSLLRLILPVQGEFSGTWGDQVNAGLTNLLDTAIAGSTTLSTDADVTLTTANFAADQARSAILLCTGARTVLRNINAPLTSKVYAVINATTGGFGVTLRGTTPTTGVTIPAGSAALCAWNGSDFIVVASNNLTANYTGVLPIANGGTASTSAAAALTALGAAASGTNTDITALNNTNGVGFGVAPTGGINASIQTKDGVRFPPTQVASTDVNTLDDYREVAWTPVSSGITGGTFDTWNGTYTKIGRAVFFTATVNTDRGTFTGSASFSLPFTSASTASAFTISKKLSSGQIATSIGSGVVGGGTANAYIPSFTATGAIGELFVFTGTYFV